MRVSAEDGGAVRTARRKRAKTSTACSRWPAPKQGARVEFGVADGRKGPQALSVTYLDPAPAQARAPRKPAEDLAVMVEDVIGLLDSLGNQLRRGRYPDKATATKTAIVLRGIADSIEA